MIDGPCDLTGFVYGAVPATPTATASATNTATATETPVPGNTSTPTETATETPEPGDTSTATATATATNEATETETPTSEGTEAGRLHDDRGVFKLARPMLDDPATETQTPDASPTVSLTPTATETAAAGSSGPITIDYTYDALNRLTDAVYSNGMAFHYTYDAAGNVLSYERVVDGISTVTSYTYDDANQLLTAAEGETTWYYTYNGNGSLVMSSPSQGEANGATRNTYNKAGYLVKVEEHNGTAWLTQSEMRYDGLGNRLEMTSYADGVGETIRYQLDNGQPLAAVGTVSTSYYLYGRGVIGTKTDSWAYVLQDGLGSTRQLATHEGVIAMSVAYTPWGDVLAYYGSGGIDFGYLGGMYDAGTGLLYMGNGRYYDPATGRFLTRGAGQGNPYRPGAFDPAGIMVAPLALLGLVLGKKKKRGKWDTFIAVLIVCVVVGMSVSACKPNNPAAPKHAPDRPPTRTSPSGSDTEEGLIPTAEPPLEDIVLPDCDGELLKYWRETPMPIVTPIASNRIYDGRKAVDWAMANYEKASRVDAIGTNCANFVSQALSDREGGKLSLTDIWKPWTSEINCTPDTVESCKTPDCPWIQTGDLHSYLIQSMGFQVRATFETVSNYSNDSEGRLNDYLLLRNNDGWSNFTGNTGIQPGDLVFYHDTRYPVWSHVAIAIGISGHTNFILDVSVDNTKMIEPYIVENDGPGSYQDPKVYVRTMGDTTNDRIGHVEILYQP